MNLMDQMDRIYSSAPLERIPWNLSDPPDLLVELIESGRVAPCRAADVGCGAGNYAVWLASRGFEVTGIDLSARAIDLANRLADEKGADCSFQVGDLVSPAFEPGFTCRFAYDWEVLHHVFPEDREHYMANIAGLLEPGGIYFSVCFSEQDPDFGGEGKYRQTPINTTLYFSSEAEIESLLAPRFEIDALRTVEIAGKYGPHVAVMAVATRT